MKKVSFTKKTKIESNTYYRFSGERLDYYLSDTIRSYNAEYRAHSVASGEYLDIAFLLKNLENVVLDFGGATLMLHGRIQPFMLDNCKNVILKNLKIDYDRPFYTQASVVEATKKYIKLKIDQGFDCRVEEDRSIVAISDWWEKKLNKNDCLLWMYSMDQSVSYPIILALFGNEIFPNKNPPLPIRQLYAYQKDGYILVEGDFPMEWEYGDIGNKLLMTHEVRDKNTIHIVGGENITVDNVTIIHGAAFGLVAMHIKNIFINRFNLIKNYGGNGRLVTNNADGIHLFNCYGRVLLQNSTMEGLMDDALNIHGNFLVVDGVKDNKIICSPGRAHGLSPALKLILKGDKIAVFKGKTRELKAEFTALEVEERIITVNNEERLSLIEAGDVIENLSANPNLLVENCTFGRFRGTMRLQTGGKIIIKNCRFDNNGASVLLTGDTMYWYESGPVKDLTIENCYFAYADSDFRIFNATEVEYTESAPYYHSGIKIKNCFFDGKYACRFDHCKDITFEDNKTTANELIVDIK